MPPIYTKGSWYSQLPPFGWFDREDKPGSAALQKDGKSVPDSEQGIALPSRRTLGQWYNVTPPGGDLPYPMQQTDVGPAKWTGRGVDISAAAAHQMGYTPKDFPTDATWKIEPRDEPRGLGSPAGMPVQAGDLPDNATGGDAYAAAPQGRKMPDDNSLMSMLSPRDIGGAPTSLGDMLAQRSNSLIGLGLGLMGGTAQDPYGRALTGYAQGASSDQDRYQSAQRLAEQRAARAQSIAEHRMDRAQAQKNWEQQFQRGGESDFDRMQRDIQKYGADTPEGKQIRDYYASKLGGGPPHTVNAKVGDEDVTYQWDAASRKYVPFQAPDVSSAAVPSPFDTGQGPGVGYTTGGVLSPTPAGATTPTTGTSSGNRRAAPIVGPDGQVYTPPAGLSKAARAEWEKEITKLSVQRQTAADAAKRAGASIDPVTEDIDRALNQIEKYPGMTTGAFSSVLKKTPIVGGSTQAGEVESLLSTIKASSSLEKLNQMRANSPNGASGLGAVTQGEHKLLQDAIGSLDQSQDAKSVLYNLDRIKRIRHEIIYGPGTAPPPKYTPPDYQQGQQGTTAKGGGGPVKWGRDANGNPVPLR